MHYKSVLAGAVLGICGTAAAAQAVPEGYPADYAGLIEQAQGEGSLLIYSNMGAENWDPIVAAFNERYPGITVETLDLGPSEVFTRYRAETGTGIGSADMMVAGSIVDWILAAEEGLLADYASPERAAVPDWSVPRPGVFTFSADPMVTIYNHILVPEELRATSMAGFFENIQAHPDLFADRVGTYDGQYAFGESINYAFARDHGNDAWRWFETSGPLVRPGGGAGGMIEKTISGEYVASYFVSGAVLFSRLDSGIGQIIDWSFPDDGTPIFLRGMGITAEAPHPAAARLMLDFLLSADGQRAIGDGRLTPYRDGVVLEDENAFSLDEILDEIGGEENMILINYDDQMITDHDAFIARWAAAFGR